MSKNLDEIDLKILNEIQADGRITNVELAKRVGISPPPCLRRVRALEEAGFADVVSNGRLEFGVGAGYQDFEFERFGVKLSDASEIFSEFLDVIQVGMRDKIFSYEGKHLRFPPTSIAMRSQQQPIPPLWLATGNPKVQARAIREGHSLFVTALLNGPEKLKAMREGLLQVAASENRNLDNTRIALLRNAFASDRKSEVDDFVGSAIYQRVNCNWCGFTLAGLLALMHTLKHTNGRD